MKETKQGKKLYIGVIVVLLAVMIFGGGYLLMIQHGNEGDFLDPKARDGILEAHTREEIQAILDKEVAKGAFNIAINTEPKFPNGRAEGDLWIENVPANHYYMSVKIILDDTNEVVFSTKAIKPNQYIQSAKLDVNLGKGTYNATAKITVTDPKTNKEISETNVKQKIIIEN